MKKNITLIFIVILLSCPIMAQDNNNEEQFNRGLSIGTVLHLDNNKVGASFELGIPLTKRNTTGLFCRDNVLLTVAGKNPALDQYSFWGEMLSFDDKIILGGIINKGNILINPYGFLECDLGLFHRAYEDYFDFHIDVSLGGGTELQLNKSSCLVAEFGTLLTFMPYQDSFIANPDAVVRVGYRHYIK